jgi:oligopeptide transport system ATP-binding protein
MPSKGIDLDVMPGETVSVVGRIRVGQEPGHDGGDGIAGANGQVAGSVRYRGQELLGLPTRDLNRVRGAKITMIFPGADDLARSRSTGSAARSPSR